MAGMERHSVVGKGQRGIAYLAMLLVVAGIGIGLASVGTVWQTASQRDRERELLFVGEEFRKAIQQYYEGSPGSKRYPNSLEDLLQDQRYPGVRRYIRQIYRDPMTGQAKWGLVRAPEGGIMGVYSLAVGTPAKQANFKASQAFFEGKSAYADWQFVYVPIGVQIRATQTGLPAQKNIN